MPPRLLLFGAPRLLDADGAPLQGKAAHRRRLAVLALLAVSRGRPVPRSRLVSLLWSEKETGDPRHALNEALSVIRRELREDPFVTAGEDVSLPTERMASDYDDFVRAVAEGDAETAVSLYEAPFLADFEVGDAPEFERWMETERRALATQFGRVLEADAQRRHDAGDRIGALTAWQRLSKHDPLATPTAIRLAEAMALAGDVASGVRHLDQHEELLRLRLDLPAPVDLRKARERLRDGTFQAPPPPISIAAPALAAPPAAPEAPVAPDAAADDPVEDVVAGGTGAGSADPDAPRTPEIDPHAHVPTHATVWLAAFAAGATPTTEETNELRSLARQCAQRAGGEVSGMVAGAVIGRFANSRAAAAAAVALLRTWESRRPRGDASPRLGIGMDHGRANEPGQRTPDEATLRASVLRMRAEPSTIVTTESVVREMGAISGVDVASFGAAVLPGDVAAEPLICLRLVDRRRRTPPAADPAAAAPPPSTRPKRRRWWMAGAGAASLVAAIGALWLAWGEKEVDDTIGIVIVGCPTSTRETLRERCDAMIDGIGLALATLPGVRIHGVPESGEVPRSFWDSSESRISPRKIANVLLLQGRVTQDGERIRFNLFVTNPAHEAAIVGVDTLETVVEGNLAAQDSVGGRIINLLQPILHQRREEMLAIRATDDLDAINLYLRARREFFRGKANASSGNPYEAPVGRARLLTADSLLRAAELRAPRWLAPTAQRVEVATFLGTAGEPNERYNYLKQALASANYAVSRHPDDPVAFRVRGQATWRLANVRADPDSIRSLGARAAADLDRALALDPDQPTALILLADILLITQGDFPRATELVERAADLSVYSNDRVAYLQQGFDNAASWGNERKALELCSQFKRDYPEDFQADQCRMVIAARFGGVDTATVRVLRDSLLAEVDTPEKADAANLDYQVFHWRVLHAAVLARAGDGARARNELESVRADIAAHPLGRHLQPNLMFDEAHVRRLLGEHDAARRLIEQLIASDPVAEPYYRNDFLFRDLFPRESRRSVQRTRDPDRPVALVP